MFKKIFQLSINGKIDQKMTRKIQNNLQKSPKFTKPKCLALSINSQGGSLVQSKNIAYILKDYCNKNDIKLYTFAEDAVLNSANIILTCGDNVYANPYSIIGDFGYSKTLFGFKKFIDSYKIQTQFITGGQYKLRLNPFEEFKDQDQQWMKQILKEQENSLKNILQLHRKNIDTDLFNNSIINADDALKAKLIDGIQTFEQFNKDNQKIHNLQQDGILDEFGIKFLRSIFYLQNNEDGFN